LGINWLKPLSKCCSLQYSLTQQGHYTTRAYISLPWWRHIYQWVLLNLGKTTYMRTHIFQGKRSRTIQVSAELLMTEWLCRSVRYMKSVPLHIARKTSASEVHYSQEALYQMLFTYIHTLPERISGTCRPFVIWRKYFLLGIIMWTVISKLYSTWVWKLSQ